MSTRGTCVCPRCFTRRLARFIEEDETAVDPARVRSHANRTMAALYFVSVHAARFMAAGHPGEDGKISRSLLEELSVLQFDIPPG